MERRREIHWKAPALMFGGIGAGVFFATSHHLFNSRLQGRSVSAENPRIGSVELPTQAINFALGTAFSFLVKTSLLLAVSTAYFQAFWRSTSGAEMTLEQLDALFALPSHPTAFLSYRAWRRFSYLLILAAVAWLIPIPAILTPATLSVVATTIEPAPIRAVDVPSIDFESLKFAAAGICNDFSTHNLTVCWYNGPQYAVQRVVNAVASHGHVLPITPPSPNSNWTLKFQGPYLSCRDVENPDRTEILDNIIAAYAPDRFNRYWEKKLDLSSVVNYLSWTPQYANETFSLVNHSITSLPYDLSSIGKQGVPIAVGLVPSQPNPLGPFLVSDGQVSLPAKILFAAIPPIHGDLNSTHTKKSIRKDSTVLECTLLNATYRASFNYVDGAQSLSLKLQDVASMTPVGAIEAFLLGADPIPHPDVLMPSIQSEKGGFNSAVLQRLSFQSVMHAFGQVFVGGVRAGMAGINTVPFQYANTTVLSTVLVKTIELSFLDKSSQDWARAMHQTHTNNASWSHAQLFNQAGAWSEPAVHARMPLKRAIEELFQNITVSLMSSPLLRPNELSPSPHPAVDVTFNGNHNVYHYAVARLWLAYGVSIIISMICVAVGFRNLFKSRASFSPTNNFSTIVRRTRHVAMTPDMEGEGDMRGSAPLAPSLASATLVMATLQRGDKDVASGLRPELSHGSTRRQFTGECESEHEKALPYVGCRSYEVSGWI